MSAVLIESKLHIPPLSLRLISRPSLNTKLEREIKHCRLAVVSAPPGYGKTTLLSDWARRSQFSVAWLTITEEDNDVKRFLGYLLAAWESAHPGIMDSPAGIQIRAQTPDIKAVQAAVLNAAYQLSDHVILVLDDYHRIVDSGVHNVLAGLLEGLPPFLHFVLAGQQDPPLPLARYRARGQLLELGIEDLVFRLPETADFLRESMGIELAAEEIKRMHERTEGWIAGLQLSALALRRNRRSFAEILPVSGKQRFIADYLREEVLSSLPQERRNFLLQTGILERLCGPLCDALTGQANGQVMLETLEREDLFLLPLDGRREWFRYHSLFHDFLESELKREFPGQVAELHSKAGRWYLENDFPEAAFQHAAAAENRELVVQIFERYLIAKFIGGEVRQAARWLEAIPEDWFAQDPDILLGRAGLLMVSGQFEACFHCLERVERLAKQGTKKPETILARVAAMRCNLACFQNDLEHARLFADQALQHLPAEDLDFRAGIYGALGDTYRRNGLWREAQAAYRKVLEYSRAPAFQVQAVHLYGALADLDLRQGQLHSAGWYWQKALAAIQQRENWGKYPLPLVGWVYIRLGELYYEWDRLNEAWEHLSQGLERAELGGDVRALIAGHITAGRLKLAQGSTEMAEKYLLRARAQLETANFPYWVSRFERLQVDLWLAQERLQTAVSWVEKRLSEADLSQRPENAISQLAAVRVLNAEASAESLQRAHTLLADLPGLARSEGRMGVYIEAGALQALTYWKQGDRTTALTVLEPVLRSAEPQGYIRLFVDLGPALGQLLQVAQARQVLPAYVKVLLAAFDEPLPGKAVSSRLPEPLTAREIDVLELLAAGLTNREIADALVIAPGTVKKHAGNIYNKLNVGNRTEAAARARELGLLE